MSADYASLSAAVSGVDADEQGSAALHDQTQQWLNSLSSDQLQQLAAEQGFEHAELVGLSGAATHPLAHWLDPSYPAGPGKAHIQTIADQRFAELAAGGTVAGLTIADLPLPPATGTTEVTPEQFIALQAGVSQALHTWNTSSLSDPGHAAKGWAAIEAENQLHDATCPDISSDTVMQAKLAARHQVDQTIGSLTGSAREISDHAIAGGALEAGQLSLMTKPELLTTMRRSSSTEDQAAVITAVDKRAATLQSLQTALPGVTACTDTSGGLTFDLSGPDGGVGAFAAAASDGFTARTHVLLFAPQVALTDDQKQLLVSANTQLGPTPQALTTKWRSFAKTQDLNALRHEATAMGLVDASSANRAQVQNYVASHWDPSLDANSIQAKIAEKNTPPKDPAAAPAAHPQGALGARPSSNWGSRYAALAAGLAHTQATTTALPQRVDAATVSGWKWGPGEKAVLGGVHAKTVHTAPDGSKWLFKPDTSAVRSVAESTASSVWTRAGLPNVPVYQVSIGAKSGTAQPLVPGATTLGPAHTWTQSDVDAIVRHQVASWAVGDHDGKPENMLRLPGGGLTSIDHGQAFKHYGEDKLASTYQPSTQTAFQIACQAAKSQKLSKGVELKPAAAHPVIKAFENIPDAQWRSMLTDTAKAGVADNAPWVTPMRARAAAKHHTSAAHVSNDQVVEAFLDTAVSRKHGLRSQFAALFKTEVGHSGALEFGG